MPRLVLSAFVGILLGSALLGLAPLRAAAQGVTPAALDARSVDRLRTERAEVAALIADLDDGNSYILDPPSGWSGSQQGIYLPLPVPIDRVELANMITLAMLSTNEPDTGFVQGLVQDALRTTQQTRAALPGLLAQYDAAIQRKAPALAARPQAGAPPTGVSSGRADAADRVDTSDADALYAQAQDMTAAERCAHGQVFGDDSCEPTAPGPARSLLFQPTVFQSVVDWFDTEWDVEVSGGEIEGSIEIGEIGRRWDSAVQFDFEATFQRASGGSSIPVRGTYDLGVVTMTFYDSPWDVRLEGSLSAETGEMEGTARLSSRDGMRERAWGARR